MSQSRYHGALGTLLLVPVVAALAATGWVFTAQRSLEAAQPPGNRVDVLIGFGLRPGPPEEAFVRSVGGQIRFRFHLVPAIAATIPAQAVQALLAHPQVTAVEPDLAVSVLDAELDGSWGVKRIGAGPAHESGIRGAGIRVAVIDTGIDYTHPDLAVNHAGGYDFVNDDADPFDDHGHGTHVAGIVAARDDDAGVVGAAPQAMVYSLKVLDATGNGAFSNVIAALQWAVDQGIQVTNNSSGTGQDPGDIVRAAFDNAEAAGVLHVAAAGNSGTCLGTGDSVAYPARYGSVIAVAATDALDASPCFSSTGPDVELSAPGVDVNSTIPGGGYQVANGTSMAAPHVAGVAALILGQGVTDANGNGRLTDEVRQRLVSTAQDLGAEGPDTWYGYGLVDARAATGVIAPRDPDVVAALTVDRSIYVLGVDAAAQLTVAVKDENGTDIPGLDPSHFTARVDGVPASVQFTPASAGRYAGALALSSLSTGTHAVDVVVTDARGESGSASASFTVSRGIKAQSIAYSVSGTGAKRSLAIVVNVVDPAGNAPVQGATVTIHVARNGVAAYGLAATTDRGGRARFTIKNAPSACYATTIAGIAIVGRIWDGSTPPNGHCF